MTMIRPRNTREKGRDRKRSSAGTLSHVGTPFFSVTLGKRHLCVIPHVSCVLFIFVATALVQVLLAHTGTRLCLPLALSSISFLQSVSPLATRLPPKHVTALMRDPQWLPIVFCCASQHAVLDQQHQCYLRMS